MHDVTILSSTTAGSNTVQAHGKELAVLLDDLHWPQPARTEKQPKRRYLKDTGAGTYSHFALAVASTLALTCSTWLRYSPFLPSNDKETMPWKNFGRHDIYHDPRTGG